MARTLACLLAVIIPKTIFRRDVSLKWIQEKLSISEYILNDSAINTFAQRSRNVRYWWWFDHFNRKAAIEWTKWQWNRQRYTHIHTSYWCNKLCRRCFKQYAVRSKWFAMNSRNCKAVFFHSYGFDVVWVAYERASNEQRAAKREKRKEKCKCVNVPLNSNPPPSRLDCV